LVLKELKDSSFVLLKGLRMDSDLSSNNELESSDSEVDYTAIVNQKRNKKELIVSHTLTALKKSQKKMVEKHMKKGKAVLHKEGD
jgi:hypothetical protein